MTGIDTPTVDRHLNQGTTSRDTEILPEGGTRRLPMTLSRPLRLLVQTIVPILRAMIVRLSLALLAQMSARTSDPRRSMIATVRHLRGIWMTV